MAGFVAESTWLLGGLWIVCIVLGAVADAARRMESREKAREYRREQRERWDRDDDERRRGRIP